MVMKERNSLGRPFNKAVRYPEQRVRGLIPEREMPHLRRTMTAGFSSDQQFLEEIFLSFSRVAKRLGCPRFPKIPSRDIVRGPLLARNREGREPLEVLRQRISLIRTNVPHESATKSGVGFWRYFKQRARIDIERSGES